MSSDGISLGGSVTFALNTTGKAFSLTVPTLTILDANGKPESVGGQTYTVPVAPTLKNGTIVTNNGAPIGSYLFLEGNATITVGGFSLAGDFDVVAASGLFRIDINQMKLSVSLGSGASFSLLATGGLLYEAAGSASGSTAGFAGGLSVTLGSGKGVSGSGFEIDGNFAFGFNNTGVSQTLGTLVVAPGIKLHVDGDVIIGSFDISASLDMVYTNNTLDLVFSGTAKLGPLGNLGVNAHLDIDSGGLYGAGAITVNSSSFSGFAITGTFMLEFNTEATEYSSFKINPTDTTTIDLKPQTYVLMIQNANLSLAGGAFDVQGNLSLTLSNSVFTVAASGTMTILGASLGGTVYASIFNDGQTEMVLYASLTINSGKGGSQLSGNGFSITANPVLEINTTSSEVTIPGADTADGNPVYIDPNSFELAIIHASIDLFGFQTSGTLIAKASHGGFDIEIPQSDPLTLNFFGIAQMQIYGDINSDGNFSVTGNISYDVKLGPFELYGDLGATISNTGFAAWFSGGANVDIDISFGLLGSIHKTFNIASVSAYVGITSSSVTLHATASIAGYSLPSFDVTLGGTPQPPSHPAGLSSYVAPTVGNAGQQINLYATIYNTSGNLIPDNGSYTWVVTGPNGYYQTATTESYVPTLGAAGTYTVSIYQTGSGAPLKQSLINVQSVPPKILDLGLQSNYLTIGANLAVTAEPSVVLTSPGTTTYKWTVVKDAGTANAHTDYYSGSNPAIVLYATPAKTTPDTYTITLDITDSLNPTTNGQPVELTQTVTTFDTSNLTVNSAADEPNLPAGDNNVADLIPKNGVMTLRRALEIINLNNPFYVVAGSIPEIHFDPSLAGQTITLLDQYSLNPTTAGGESAGSTSLEILNPTLFDGSQAPGLTITNDSATSGVHSRLFYVASSSSGSTLPISSAFKNLILAGGTADYVGGMGGAIDLDSTSSGYGGVSPTVTATNVLFKGNVASLQGGAVAFGVGGTFNATDCTFEGNTVGVNNGTGGGGGAIYCGGKLYLTNDTIVNNILLNGSAYEAGAGVDISSSRVTVNIANTIIALNTGSTDLAGAPGTPISTYGYSNNGNFIGTGDASVTSGALGTYHSKTDLNLGALAERGPDGIPVYSLLPGSKALNGGITAAVSGTLDGRGYARISNGTVDSGAYEHQAEVVTTTDITGIGSLDDIVAADDDGSNITFSSSLNGEQVNVLTSGSSSALTPLSSYSIIGPDANLLGLSAYSRVPGNDTPNYTRLFNINAGITTTITGLAISNGWVIGRGGAFYNSGTLTLANDYINNNLVTDPSGILDYNQGGASYGGAIYNDSGARLIINGDTFAANSAQAYNESAGGNYAVSVSIEASGGAIYNAQNASITGINDTFANNSADGGTYSGNVSSLSPYYNNFFGHAYGGAIRTAGSGTGSVTLTNATFASNSVQDGWGNVDFSPTYQSNGADIWTDGSASLILTNSILASTSVTPNSKVSSPPTPVSLALHGPLGGSNNLVVATSGSNYATAIVSTAAPALRPLANYGGSVPTMVPIAGGAELGVGTPVAALTSDARGFTVVNSKTPDLGAVQLHSYVVTSAADSGTGSLRQTILNDIDQSPITFSSALNNTTIYLKTPIILTKDVNIVSTIGLTIDAQKSGRILVINSGVSSTISGLNLLDGIGNEGGAILNNGKLTLNSDYFYNNTAQGDTTAGPQRDGRGGSDLQRGGIDPHRHELDLPEEPGDRVDLLLGRNRLWWGHRRRPQLEVGPEQRHLRLQSRPGGKLDLLLLPICGGRCRLRWCRFQLRCRHTHQRHLRRPADPRRLQHQLRHHLHR